jgi:serine-type D-Ala-D-Ala carboxypeptidase/endopeptidase
MMKHSLSSLVLFLIASPWLGAHAQSATTECVSGDAALAAIDPLFEAFAREQHVPGLIYGVVREGKLVHCKAVGVSNVATQEPVTIDTVFRIASMTKSFTALAVLKLRDAGKLSLEAPAAKWVPELAQSRYPAADAREIRVLDLLAHTAGFVTDDPWGDRQLDMPDAEFSRVVAAGIPFARTPGVAWEYSNYGYALLGRVVTNASGVRYQDYVQREILQPLGMKSSGWEAARIPAKLRAIGYRYEDATWREEPVLADGAFTSMGGLHTSARDYVAYVNFLLSAWVDREAGSSTIVAKHSRRQLVQGTGLPALSLANPADPTSCAAARVYGMGMHSSRDCRFDLAVGHSGGLPGYGSNVLLLPDYDVGIFAFANRTYTPASAVVQRAAARLYDAGVLKKRSIAPSEALERAQEVVAKIYAAGAVRAVPEALANNFLLDRDAEKRDADLAAVKTTLRNCRSESKMNVKHALSAVMRFPCDRGTLVATVLLAPTLEPSLQVLRFAAED